MATDGTGIAWTDATWNPTRGCSRVSEGCRNCYAERQAARMAGPGGAYEGLVRPTPGGPAWTGKVRLVPEVLDQPLRWTRPRRIFVDSMSDLFHEGLTNEAIAAVFGVMAASRRHTFQVLTKRPARMLDWFGWIEQQSDGTYMHPPATVCVVEARRWGADAAGAAMTWPPPNVWLGVSVEDQRTADERIPLLLSTPAAVRFVSYEPALGPVDFTLLRCADAGGTHWDVLNGRYGIPELWHGPLHRLDWLIVGGESGPGARPFDLAWARATVAACRAAGVPCFVKQLGARPYDGATAPDLADWIDGQDAGRGSILLDRKGGDPAEWPEDLRVREFPR